MEELFLEERSSIERLRWLEQADEEAVPPGRGHGGCDRYDHARLITIQISFQWEGKVTSPTAVPAVAAVHAGARHLLL